MSTEYQYDAGSRLTALIYRNGGGELGRLTYAYDLATNRAAVGGSFAATLLPDALASATYNARNRQTVFGAKTLSYDDNGNLTQIAEGSNVTIFGWDSRNRLTSFILPQPTTATFSYDARGRRASKTIDGTTTQFQYDGPDVARELIGGNATGYVFGPGIDEPLIRGGAEFFLSDALGSTVSLTDASGAITNSYQYEPFGRSASEGAPSANSMQFTGRENDGTGLQYFRARYYMPGLHRFVSEDPIGFGGGDTNLYAYVFSNPTGYTDPSGVAVESDGPGGPSEPPTIDCLDSSPPGTPGCGGGQGSTNTGIQLACGPPCAAIALLRAAIIAAGGAAIAQQIIDMLPPLSWDDLHSSAASDAKSDEEYQKHRRKLDDARRELENLKSERDSRKGPKARAPFDRQIRDLERQVAGHEKEMSQKWPDRPR